MLADPEIILRQAAAQPEGVPPVRDSAELERRIAETAEQQQRLARLFISGTLPEDALQAESHRLATERALLEADLEALRVVRPQAGRRTPTFAEAVAAAGVLRAWLATPGEADYRLMLQALSVTVTAAPDRAKIVGSIPVLQGSPDSVCQDDIFTIVRTSACVFESDQEIPRLKLVLGVALAVASGGN